ncbi:MAG: arylamine N-acetyltransferase, partial [Paracoccaceae bacterium]
MTHFDRSAYLARIGLTNVPATAAGLAALQAAQLAAVPFENIDPLMGIEPALAPEAIWDKIVAGRRGGYCFELNSLLGAALSEFGFPARRVMARVRM